MFNKLGLNRYLPTDLVTLIKRSLFCIEDIKICEKYKEYISVSIKGTNRQDITIILSQKGVCCEECNIQINGFSVSDLNITTIIEGLKGNVISSIETNNERPICVDRSRKNHEHLGIVCIPGCKKYLNIETWLQCIDLHCIDGSVIEIDVWCHHSTVKCYKPFYKNVCPTLDVKYPNFRECSLLPEISENFYYHCLSFGL